MTREEARKLLSSLAPDEADKIFEAAEKAAGQPKTSRYTEKNSGRYNSVITTEIASDVLSVKDASKSPLTFTRVGQQVVCSRTLGPPVVIEFVTQQDADEHDAKIAKELERLRPKG